VVELAQARAEPRILVGEPVVVLFHVHEVDVLTDEGGHTARQRRGRILERRRDAEDGLVEGRQLTRVSNARAAKERRGGEPKYHEDDVPVALEGAHGRSSRS